MTPKRWSIVGYGLKLEYETYPCSFGFRLWATIAGVVEMEMDQMGLWRRERLEVKISMEEDKSWVRE